MSIIALRAWYLQEYEPIKEVEKRPPDIRLSKKSLLRSALRADFLEDSEEVKRSTWFERYLEGENIEFYIEGSGGYCVANIDLISHEIYFTKQSLLAQLEPTIFFSYQRDYSAATDALREGLQECVDSLNKRSRLPLQLIEAYRPKEGGIKLSGTMMRKIRKSLLFIGDITPIAIASSNETTQLIPNPQVCVEIGHAIHSKRSEQILLAQMQRQDMEGEVPFDLQPSQIIQFQNEKELSQILPKIIETQLLRFKLFV